MEIRKIYEQQEHVIHHKSVDDTSSTLNLLKKDFDKILAGKVLFMAIAKEDAEQFNQQSCDCTEVLIVMSDCVLLAKHVPNGEDGAISFAKLSFFDEEKYKLRVAAPLNGSFEFVKILYTEDGAVDGVKYHFGNRYVFIFASEYNLIVTKSVVDLFEEDDTPIPKRDSSILFE